MRLIFDPRQLAHAPTKELHNGGWVDHVEHGGRARSILDAISATQPPSDHGEAPILALHTPDYVDFLKTAFTRWRDAGRPGDAGGYVWPLVGRRPLDLDRIDALIGRYSFDAATPIAEGTWSAAYWAAQTALSGLDAVLSGERAAFALCRPPGHHAGADYLGGYCYLNNAAIAAEAATRAGKRTAILDIDYHQGNGTQDIFYARGDVFFASIHADPRTDYPFYWGHADERGEGAGEGATLNLPLPHGTTLDSYLRTLDTALDAIATFAPELIVVSFGADTFEGDPISNFALQTADYATIARRIAALVKPVLIVMEGGYAVDALGANVATFLEGFA